MVQKHPPCGIAAHHPGQDCFVCCHDDGCLQQQMKLFAINFIPMTTPTIPTTAASMPTTPPKQGLTFQTAHVVVTATAPPPVQTSTPRMQLCPLCTDAVSMDNCRANLHSCDTSFQVCEISMKDLKFSSKCVDRHICEKQSVNESLANCALHGFAQHDDCTRCCTDDACINATMVGLDKARSHQFGSIAFCPHCMFTTDPNLCTKNTRPCIEPSGHDQGCHIMNHPDGKYSAGCSYDLPHCKIDIEIHNPQQCQLAGFPVNSTCHFCCDNRTCVAETLNMNHPAPSTLAPTTTPPPSATTVPVTTAGLPVWCKDQDDRCAEFKFLYSICAVNASSSGFEFISKQCARTCNKCDDYKAFLDSHSVTIPAAATTPPTTAPVTRQPLTATAPPTPANASIECYECQYDEFTCEDMYQKTQCHSPNDYCINHLKNNRDGTRTVIRRCGTLLECKRDWWLTYSDDDKCTRFNSNYVLTNNFECKYCCTTPLCNQNVRPDKATLFAVKSRK